MFAEIRTAIDVSQKRGRALTADEVWRMATSEGYRSFGNPGKTVWDFYEGATTPIIRIDVNEAQSTEELIERGDPSEVSWMNWTGDPWSPEIDII